MLYPVRYFFGRRLRQDSPGLTGRFTEPFAFTVAIDAVPSSWDSAYALLGFFRGELVRQCHAAKIWMSPHQRDGWDSWIPGEFLDAPIIEVFNGECYEELPIDENKPNPWLPQTVELLVA